MTAMNKSCSDPVILLAEAASRMGVNQRRARNILLKNGISPVRTVKGIGYRLDDVNELKKASR